MNNLTTEKIKAIIDGAPDENHAIEVNEQVIPTSLRQVHHYIPDLRRILSQEEEILALRERTQQARIDAVREFVRYYKREFTIHPDDKDPMTTALEVFEQLKEQG